MRYAAFQAASSLVDAEKIDHDFYGDIFSIPSMDPNVFDDDEEQDKEENDDDQDTDDDETEEIIRNVEVLQVNDIPGGLKISDNDVGMPYPIQFTANLAFMVSSGDAFKAYSKDYDFDLGDREGITFITDGAKIIYAESNLLRVEISEPGGSVSLTGFGSSRIDTRIKIDS